jgi:RND family efflux transporter MFP subunit
MSGKTLLWVLALIGAVGAAAVFARRPTQPAAAVPSAPEAPTAPAQAPAAPAPPRKSVDWVGVVLARDAADVSAKSAGKIEEVYVKLGDRVKRDDKLAKLDAKALQHDLQLARASLAAARAELAKSNIELADAKERSERRAAVEKEISREELSGAAVKQKLSEADLEGARAHVEEQRARVDQLLESLSSTEVRAPFDGTVAARYLGPGTVVSPGTPIVRIIRSNDLGLRFAVPADQAHELRIGARVQITLDVGAIVLAGAVEQFAPEVDPVSGMIVAEAALEIPPEARSRIESGLVGRVHMVAEARRDGGTP